MKIKEIDFSAFQYKRICVYDANQTHYPPNSEALVISTHGEREAEDEISVDELGWLTIVIKGSQTE